MVLWRNWWWTHWPADFGAPYFKTNEGRFFCSHGYNGYNKFIPLTNHEINPVGFQPLTYYNEAPLTVSSLKKKLDLESSLAATKWWQQPATSNQQIQKFLRKVTQTINHHSPHCYHTTIKDPGVHHSAPRPRQGRQGLAFETLQFQQTPHQKAWHSSNRRSDFNNFSDFMYFAMLQWQLYEAKNGNKHVQNIHLAEPDRPFDVGSVRSRRSWRRLGGSWRM
jgi:hypothetical protein